MKKTLITILVTVLVCGSVFGTTLAFLMDKTETVTNTFTFGNIDIELAETKGTVNDGVRSFKMMPGATIDKDPTITVKAGSEACWLFVEVEATNVANYLTYSIATGWTPLNGVAGVYYQEVAAVSTDTTFSVLKDNKVTVNSDITKKQIDDLTSGINADPATAEVPTLTFTAYAVQKDTTVDTAAEAWSIATTGNLPNT